MKLQDIDNLQKYVDEIKLISDKIKILQIFPFAYKLYKKEHGKSPLLYDNIFIMSYNYASKISEEILINNFHLVVIIWHICYNICIK